MADSRSDEGACRVQEGENVVQGRWADCEMVGGGGVCKL